MSRKINRLLKNSVAICSTCYIILYITGIINIRLIWQRTPAYGKNRASNINSEKNSLYPQEYRLLLKNVTVQEKIIVWNNKAEKRKDNEDDSSGKLPQLLATSVVNHINRKIRNSPQCQLLNLASVLSCRKVEVRGVNGTSSNKTTKYLIKLQTTPGNGTFEAVVESRGKSFVGKQIERVDEHEKQSYCQQERSLKPFCYCVPIL